MLGHSRERAARLSYRVQAHGDTHLKGQVSISAIQDNKGERGRKGKLKISQSYRGAFLVRHSVQLPEGRQADSGRVSFRTKERCPNS